MATGRALFGPVMTCAVVLLVGCASTDAGRDLTPTSPSPTSACAVAEQPGVEPPAGCIVYDTDDNMASNELYRQRMPQPEAGQTAAAALIGPVTDALTALRVSGVPITDQAVRTALTSAGVREDAIQTGGSTGSIAYGAAIDGGGCVFGGVTVETVSAEAGGFIMDGGCLAMIGH